MWDKKSLSPHMFFPFPSWLQSQTVGDKYVIYMSGLQRHGFWLLQCSNQCRFECYICCTIKTMSFDFFYFFFLWISDKAQSTYVQRRPSSTQHYQDISCTGVGKLTANFPAFLQLIQRRRWFATINNPDPSKKWKTTKQEFIWGGFKPQFIFLHRGKI